MAFNISAWSIRKPIMSLVLFTVLIIIGLISFRSLPITRFPNIDVPIVSVQITQSGAAPAELETQVTKKVEDAIAGVTGVKHMTSSITDGTSTTNVEFRLETNVDRAINDVKDAIARIRGDLPKAIDEPITRRIEIEGGSIMSFGVSAPAKTMEEISWFIDDVVVRKLQSAKGVASVERNGGIDREIHVALAPDRLASLNVTAADINKQLRATNVDVAGGRSEVAGQEQAIRTLAGTRKVEDLGELMVSLPGNRKIRLGDLGTVTDTAAEPRLFARLNGQPIVSFSVFRAKGESDAAVAKVVKAKVDELRAENPDYSIGLIDTSVDYTHVDQSDGWIMRAYTRVVRASVRHRWLTLIAGLGLFTLSIYSINFLPKGFIPPGDEARLLVSIELPPGSRLADTQRVTDDISHRLLQRPEVATVIANGGYLLGNGGKEIRKATLIVNLVHKTKRVKSQKDIENDIGNDLNSIPDMRFWFVQPNGQRGLSLIVAGSDTAQISKIAAQLQSEMKRIPLLANPVSTASLDRPEVQIKPKSEIAAELGVSTDAISETIRLATIGDVGVNLAKFNAGDRLIPIRVQLIESARGSLDLLQSLKVATASGKSVPLSAVADVELAQGPTSIDRYDRTRRVAVEADLVGNAALGAALDSVYALPVVKNLPAGVTIKQTGDAEVQGEVFSGFASAMGAGLMMVYGVLVLLFGSVFQPITILFSLPLSIAVFTIMDSCSRGVWWVFGRFVGERDDPEDDAVKLRPEITQDVVRLGQAAE
eukprot:gene7722-7783_t